MNRTFVLMLVGLFLAVFSFSAMAAEGPYIGFKVGAVFLEDADNEFDNIPFSFETEFDTGISVEGAVGYDFGVPRLEVEVGYRLNDFDKLSVPGFGSVEMDGDVSILSFLVNGYVDYENQSVITPYIGVGIGFANVSLNDAEILVPGFPPELIVDDDDTVFAYQVGAGLGIGLSETIALDLGYRFIDTSDPEFTDVDGDTFESETESHNIYAGLRFVFQ